MELITVYFLYDTHIAKFGSQYNLYAHFLHLTLNSVLIVVIRVRLINSTIASSSLHCLYSTYALESSSWIFFYWNYSSTSEFIELRFATKFPYC